MTAFVTSEHEIDALQKFKHSVNEIHELFQFPTNDKQHVMLIMDKILSLGNNFHHHVYHSTIFLLEIGVEKAKEYTKIDRRFERYISAFETLLEKRNKAIQEAAKDSQ